MSKSKPKPLKGKAFEAEVRDVLYKLQSNFPTRVEVKEQLRMQLYDGQNVIPDFDLHINFGFERAGYLIECQHRKRSAPDILQKIKYIKGLSARNRFLFVYAEKLPASTRAALERDGVMSMSFKQFVAFVSRISVELDMISSEPDFDEKYEQAIRRYVENEELLKQLREAGEDDYPDSQLMVPLG